MTTSNSLQQQPSEGPQGPGQAKRRRRWPWVVAGVPAALVLAVVLCEAAGWPFLRGPLQNAATKGAAVPVALDGKFQLRLIFSPHVSADHVRIGAASGIAVPHLLDAQGLRVDWRWGDVWRWRQGGPIRIHALQADTLDAHLVRLPDGRATWQLGGRKEPKPESDDSQLPVFGIVRVGAGHIDVDDSPSKTKLVVDLRGSDGSAMAAAGGLEASAKGTWRALPLRLTARAGGALPLLQDDEEGRAAQPVPVRVEGEAGAARIFFDGTAAALMRAQRLEGALRFSGPSLAAVGEPLGLTLPRTPAFELRGRLGHDAGLWRLQADQATIGRSRLAGDFRFDTRAKPAVLTGRLSGSRLALADLGPAVGADTGPRAAAAPAPAKRERVLPQREFDLPSLRAMNADVQVVIDELDFGSEALAPFRGLQTQVLLQDGLLQLQALKATVAGGQFSGAMRLDGRPSPAQYAADLRFAGVDIAGWVRGVQTPAGTAPAPAGSSKAAAPPSARALRQQRDAARQGGDQPVRSYVSGVINGSIDVTGSGRSTGQILASLDGKADVLLRDGTVSHLVTEALGIDIAQAVGVLVRGDQPLPLRCARVNVTINDGVVVPQTAVLDNEDSTVRIDGRINLADETLALRVVTRPRDFSPMALRTPLLLTGTLSNPNVGIDPKGLAGRLAAAAALGVVFAPAAALLALMDAGSGDKGDACAVAAPAAATRSAAAAASAARR